MEKIQRKDERTGKKWQQKKTKKRGQQQTRQKKIRKKTKGGREKRYCTQISCDKKLKVDS